MKTLVTGGAGFIGSHVVRGLLQTGSEVAILDDFNDFYDPQIKRANVKEFNGEAEVIEADIRDASAMKEIVGRGGYDSIIHIAARAGVRPSVQNPFAYIETNVVGTSDLLEAARLRGSAGFCLPPVPRSMVWRERCLFRKICASSDIESVCRYQACRGAPLRKLLPSLATCRSW